MPRGRGRVGVSNHKLQYRVEAMLIFKIYFNTSSKFKNKFEFALVPTKIVK